MASSPPKCGEGVSAAGPRRLKCADRAGGSRARAGRHRPLSRGRVGNRVAAWRNPGSPGRRPPRPQEGSTLDIQPLPIRLDDLLDVRKVESDRLEFKQGWNPPDVPGSLWAFPNDFQNYGGGYTNTGVGPNPGRPGAPPPPGPPAGP